MCRVSTYTAAIIMSTSDLDYALALSLQEQFSRELKHESGRKRTTTTEPEAAQLLERYDPRLIVDKRWELLDPHPNVHDLFVQFDAMFFERRLVNAGVEVRWSPRMTLCAGVCSYEGRGGLCSVRLSVPLLKLRPRKDLVETLLHEMVHAYLFIMERNTDHDGHGPNFCAHMNRINSLTGANITIYHTFHQEVKLYQQHWWKCNGPCRDRPPFYGWVKRAMNRAPSQQDRWWNDHQSKCGGSYIKVKEPEGYGKKAKRVKVEGETGSVSDKGPPNSGCKDIKKMLKGKREKGDEPTLGKSKSSGSGASSGVFDGKGHKLETHDSLSGGSGDQPATVEERRVKLLEAAERRQQSAQEKGIKRKSKTRLSSDSRDIRDFWSESPKHKEKRPELDSTTPSLDITATDTQGTSASSYHYSPHKSYRGDSLNSKSHLVGSIEVSGGNEKFTEGRPVVIGGSGSETDRDVIVIDDDDEESGDLGVGMGSGDSSGEGVPLGMCPVCGRLDIPKDIINIHVSDCLDEQETTCTIIDHS